MALLAAGVRAWMRVRMAREQRLMMQHAAAAAAAGRRVRVSHRGWGGAWSLESAHAADTAPHPPPPHGPGTGSRAGTIGRRR
ncbi:hypothetical protein OG496_00445 [Streptomyces sp. NBC_00988]|uniref:hypothetical protein n=1 Tax=Streptomyces sp. NBC_00988 TaxID=2903704 RepID=UPI00386CEE31|nr:hypothetical protein OG496_00445 [Streptomyces sp. NBC_00988]